MLAGGVLVLMRRLLVAMVRPRRLTAGEMRGAVLDSVAAVSQVQVCEKLASEALQLLSLRLVIPLCCWHSRFSEHCIFLSTGLQPLPSHHLKHTSPFDKVVASVLGAAGLTVSTCEAASARAVVVAPLLTVRLAARTVTVRMVLWNMIVCLVL